MQDACNARGLNITSIALLGTQPIVPKDLELPHKLGYILGPILGVLAIITFFGAMAFLAYEKHRHIRDAQKNQDVEAAKRKANKPSTLGALTGILTCAACRGGKSRGAAAKPAGKAAATPPAGVSPAKQPQQTTPNTRAAPAAGAPEGGVSPTRDPRNLSPLNLFKSGKREAGAAQAPAQNDFMTSNPVYGSPSPATPASGGRSPVTDFFRSSSRKVQHPLNPGQPLPPQLIRWAGLYV